jgi:5-formyltetrahydrofolate cyclo-ligase
MILPSVLEEKQRLRSEIRKRRRDLSPEQVNAWSRLIAEHFCSWSIYRSCRTVMFYLATADEVQTDLMISDALGRGKTVGVPLLGEKYGEMTAAEITSLDNLLVGKYGLKMPDPEKSKCISPASLVVVPAVSFDRSGNRLGLGAGYYDRFLPEAGSSVLIGLAWECQLTGELPNEPHDVRMHYLLTESGLISCRS